MSWHRNQLMPRWHHWAFWNKGLQNDPMGSITDLVRLKSKYFYSYERNKTPENNRQKKFEHKMVSPAKWPKCRYDFAAFTWRNSLILLTGLSPHRLTGSCFSACKLFSPFHYIERGTIYLDYQLLHFYILIFRGLCLESWLKIGLSFIFKAWSLRGYYTPSVLSQNYQHFLSPFWKKNDI